MAGGAARDGIGRQIGRRFACVAILGAVFAHISAASAPAADPVIAAGGDVACSASSSNYNNGNGTADKCRQKYTSNLLVNAGLSSVLVLGDSQYESASLSGLKASYDPTWGRVKSITRPALGNHEYKTANAAGYFDYFNGVGASTGPAGDRSKGYYSFNVGTWHLIALNSSDHCTIVSCAAGSAQEVWLKSDLAANSDKYCTLAYWHDPRFNSGHDGNADEMKPLFQALYDANADVVLAGHAHDYERFAPQNPSGSLDNTRGIRQFVVGTGGAFFTSVGTPKPNSQVRQNNTYGVLKLTLHPTGYDWQFVPEAGKTFTDSGTGTCHGGTPPPSDTTKPSIPGNLSATAGTGQVSLSWNQSTDNVGVTGYRVFRGATQIATVGTGTSYTDTNLTPGTYSYTVRAIDAAGNVSDPSNSASATVADTTKPTPPTLTATGSAGQVALSWQGATDNIAVTGYRVFRGTTQIATLAGSVTSYTDSGLAAGSYSYTVRAIDAAGNLSDPSNAASATVPDTQKPTVPGSLSASAPSSAAVDLNWQASQDNVGVSGYRIYRDGVQIATAGASATSYSDTTVSVTVTYRYVVRAIDAAGNLSDPSNEALVTVPDTVEPTAPGNLRTSGVTSSQVDLRWNVSTDNVAVTGYRVFRNDVAIANVSATTTSYSDGPIGAGTYRYTVRALDGAGNLSNPSNEVTADIPDTESPTAPANLDATARGTFQIDLTWDAAADNVGVVGYLIYRDDVHIDTVSEGTSYTDNVLAPAGYTYYVRAVDDAGNLSGPSNSDTVTVLPPDSDKPTAPGNLTAALNGTSQVDLNWEESQDNVLVTAYRVYRNDQLIATIEPGTSYSDTDVPAGLHEYIVRAEDGAGNLSDPSNTASATVPDTEKPTPPANLRATATASQVDLAWDASGDNVAVTGYKIYRDGALTATLGAVTSYSDTSVSEPGYEYEVRAFDAAGNLSDPSNRVTATLTDAQKPTAPGNLAASAAGPNQVDLTWNASSDNIGVTGYTIYRDDTPIATLGAVTSYSDTGVAGSTTYAYTVRAFDAAGNVSDPSNSASATTPTASAVFTFSPEADARTQSSTPTTNYATSFLRVDGSSGVTTVESLLRFTVSGAPAGSIRSAKLRVYAYSGTVDGPAVFATNPAWDETAVNWNNRPPRTSATTDDKGAIATNSWLEYDVTSFVTANGTYSFGLTGTSSDGIDIYSREAATLRPELVVTTGAPDTQKPTPPPGLTATAISASRVDLSWQAAGDNVGVTGYRIFRNDNQIASVGVTSAYSDTTVAPNSSYSYQVRAVDAAGNVSDPSNSASATTPPAATILTLSPEADARVHEASPTTNYGTAYLRANGGSELDVESFLRFTVTGAPAGSVQSAKLRLYNYNGTADGPAVYTTNTSWSETAVNWNTRPARTSAATSDKGAIPTNSWVEYDVTAFVTGNGTYSFSLATTSNDGIDFYNREAATLRPELVVTLR